MPCISKSDWTDAGLIASAAATWPSHDWGHWHSYAGGKLASKSTTGIPRAVQLILDQMATIPVKQLLGVDCFPDLEYLHGAGMHWLSDGLDLGLHLDTERHPVLPWKREATALVYLDTCISGGELDLTDASGRVSQRISPVANKLVLFTTPGQWHRVNKCTSNRRSICLFFWSICGDEFVGGEHATFR